MGKITEAMLQQAILEWLKHVRGAYFFRSGAGQVRLDSGRFFKTGRPGCPDITACFNGRFIGLEVKTRTGRQSALQKKAEREIIAAGGEYHIVRCMNDVKKIISGGDFKCQIA